MKKVNWKKLIGLNLLVVLMIISPFIPGPSNKLVQAFSVTGQVMGTLGLIFVPIGLVWVFIQIRKFRKPNEEVTDRRLHYRLAISASLLIAFVFLLGFLLLPNPMPRISFLVGLILILTGLMIGFRQIKKWKDNNEQVSDHGALVLLAASVTACLTFIYLLLMLAVLVGIGIIPGILGLLVLTAGLFWLQKQIRKLKEINKTKFIQLPLYLVTIPLIAFLTYMFVMEPASNFSRSFAIKKSQALIAAIEEYKIKTGQYPESIQELDSPSKKKLSKTFVMGIDNFRYNKINDQYSISFSQWLQWGSLEVIVLYDKNNLKNNLTGEFAKYDYSLDLHRVKGAFASHDTRYDNWQYYLVD